MTEHLHKLSLTPNEIERTAIFLNVLLRGATDDPTFAGRFPATTGEFRAKTLNDVYFSIFGRDHDEVIKKYGQRHAKLKSEAGAILLTDEERAMFRTELKNELDSRPHLTIPYREVLESIARKLTS